MQSRCHTVRGVATATVAITIGAHAALRCMAAALKLSPSLQIAAEGADEVHVHVHLSSQVAEATVPARQQVLGGGHGIMSSADPHRLAVHAVPASALREKTWALLAHPRVQWVEAQPRYKLMNRYARCVRHGSRPRAPARARPADHRATAAPSRSQGAWARQCGTAVFAARARLWAWRTLAWTRGRPRCVLTAARGAASHPTRCPAGAAAPATSTTGSVP